MDTPLFSNARERRQYDDLADLYAIIKATEHLEKAYAMDAIKNDEYTQACLKLIAQFKSTENCKSWRHQYHGGFIQSPRGMVADPFSMSSMWMALQ